VADGGSGGASLATETTEGVAEPVNVARARAHALAAAAAAAATAPPTDPADAAPPTDPLECCRWPGPEEEAVAPPKLPVLGMHEPDGSRLIAPGLRLGVCDASPDPVVTVDAEFDAKSIAIRTSATSVASRTYAPNAC
jgi:hypothetical protein